MGDAIKASTVAEARAKTQRNVESPVTGIVYTLRMVGPVKLARVFASLPREYLDHLEVEKAADAVPPEAEPTERDEPVVPVDTSLKDFTRFFMADPGGFDKAFNLAIEYGVVAPAIWRGDGEAPDDHLTTDDVSADAMWLFNEVFQQQREESAEGTSFRDGPGPGDEADAGPAGTEVRKAAE